jgi:hypothetical protein
MRLGAQTANRRYELEQAMMENVFWANLDRPGVVVFQLADVYDATIAFEADAEEWEDERAFDKKWFSVMTVTLQLPALVLKGDVHDIEEIRLALAEDLTSPSDEIPDSKMETVSIDEDGSLTPVANP